MKVTWKKAVLAVCLLPVLLGFAHTAIAEVGVSASSIVVGCSNSFSGPLAFCGTEMVNNGIEIYFRQIDEQGGVNGRKLIMKSYDDGYDPTRAVANTKRLVEEDKVFCILEPQGSSPVAATLDYLEQQKVPLLFPFQGLPLTGKMVFTAFTSYPRDAEIVIDWLARKKGFKRIGMIYQDDQYGHAYLDTALKRLKGMGMDLAAQESVKRGSLDLSAQMVKLKQADLDVLWVVLVPGPGAMVLKEAKKEGWTKTKLLATSPLTDEKFIILSGGEGEGVWGFSVWPDPVHSQMPAVVEYRKLLQKYVPGHEPNRYSIFGYFYAKLFVESLKRAGKDLTREKLVETFESIKNWQNGIIPPVSFSRENHAAQENGFMVEVRNNVFEPISGWLSLENGKLVERPLGE
jgi:ABC-type branched-subunit amino acid transport system substrate-binding protein